jgi:hypothetical protein
MERADKVVHPMAASHFNHPLNTKGGFITEFSAQKRKKWAAPDVGSQKQ